MLEPPTIGKVNSEAKKYERGGRLINDDWLQADLIGPLESKIDGIDPLVDDMQLMGRFVAAR